VDQLGYKKGQFYKFLYSFIKLREILPEMVFEANKSFPPLKNKRKFGGKRKN
jgi:hypothetical protein